MRKGREREEEREKSGSYVWDMCGTKIKFKLYL